MLKRDIQSDQYVIHFHLWINDKNMYIMLIKSVFLISCLNCCKLLITNNLHQYLKLPQEQKKITFKHKHSHQIYFSHSTKTGSHYVGFQQNKPFIQHLSNNRPMKSVNCSENEPMKIAIELNQWNQSLLKQGPLKSAI